MAGHNFARFSDHPHALSSGENSFPASQQSLPRECVRFLNRKRIREDVLRNERAEYGQEIVRTLSAELTAEYGRGFDRRNLHYMVRFAEFFPDQQIVNALRSQLSWTHFRELLSIEDRLNREF